MKVSRFDTAKHIAMQSAPIIVFLVSGWFSYMALVDDASSRLEWATRKEAELRMEFEAKHQKSAQLTSARRKHSELRSLVEGGLLLPQDAAIDSMQIVGEIAAAHGVTIRSTKDIGIEEFELYEQRGVEITVSGDFKSIGAFARDVAAAPQLIVPQSWSMRADRVLTLTARLGIIRFSDYED
jgi:Tfp pilus assembly protein PilO